MKKFTKVAAGILVSASLALTPLTALGSASQNGADMVVLNPGGGKLVTGADGIQMIFNSSGDPQVGSDQIYFAQTDQWCCNGGGPVLNVGGLGYSYGEAGAAYDVSFDSWDTVAVSNVTGASQRITAGGSSITSTQTGNATATLTYTKTVDSKVYTVVRAITYTYPNDFFDETWTVTIPAGNTAEVKLYVGGDVAPGGDDNGSGSTQEVDGKRTNYEANLYSGIFISYGELDAAKPFSHYFVGEYDAPYELIEMGEDLPDTMDPADHDAGLQVQWDLGTTPGSYANQMRTRVSFNTNIPGFVEVGRVPLALDLALDASVGEIVPGTDVILQGGGLIANSPLELVMRSTPVVIDLDGQRADGSGNFFFPATLPDPIEPGRHSLTLTGYAPDGSPVSDVLYFEIGADGKLLWASMVDLADTGADNGQLALLGGLAALSLVAGAVVVVRRRKA
jgi:LPXTG-motif cell wall-anchored protein